MNIDRVVSRLQQAARVVVEETAQAGGKNEVTLASGPATLDGLRAEFQERVPPEVTEFFSAVDEVHLPDLWNGYFIGSPQQIADVHRARRPQFVKHAGKLHDVMIVATTGNGVRYAIPVPEDGPVWVLPPAPIVDGAYQADDAEALVFRVIAPHFGFFVEQIATYAIVEDGDPFDPYRFS
ncbi:hypothetical protein GCM10009765_66120 [Fodinicola feengrottensis]|uniref:SMI1/KNR4 family protein n=1 Tax=Fodinicola feengrottensis TaxID=435914 RepID=A0ABN2ILG4_9ACTN